jgi:hypothetical protein
MRIFSLWLFFLWADFLMRETITGGGVSRKASAAHGRLAALHAAARL